MFPKYIPTIASQLSAKHLSWTEYAQDMGIDPHRDGTVMTKAGPACGHPKVNAVDLTDTTGPANDSYATRHNPFVYFAGIIDDKSYCDSHVVSFDPLASNLKHASTTPNYSFVTPNTCNDGHDWPKCQDGSAGRLPKVNAFLQEIAGRRRVGRRAHLLVDVACEPRHIGFVQRGADRVAVPVDLDRDDGVVRHG